MTSRFIDIPGGRIQGVASPIDPEITMYLGVPFGGSTGGARRWLPAPAIRSWDGVRIANKTGPICPQPPIERGFGMDTLEGVPQNEECLHSNIYVPNPSAGDPACPVLVWIHGGVFGFIGHPELSAESPSHTSGMYAVKDVNLALKWIQSNIAAFGGDPTKVTVAGQSAGAGIVHTLLVAPMSKGLFHRAILQSGVRSLRDPATASAAISYRTQAQAEEDGIELCRELGISTLSELRAYSDLDRLSRASLKRNSRLWGSPPALRLVKEDHMIPASYGELFASPGGVVNDVPILIGANSHEGCVYNEPRFSMEDLHECAAGRFGPAQTHSHGSEELLKRYLALYPSANTDEGQGPLEAWNASARDNMRLGLADWAQSFSQHTRSPVYGYYFTHAPTPTRSATEAVLPPKSRGFTNFKGTPSGAFHGAEVPYVFNNPTKDTRWSPLDVEVAEKVSSLWANFVKCGDPNGETGSMLDPQGVGHWAPLTDGQDLLLELGGDFTVQPMAAVEIKAFWHDYWSLQQLF